MKPHNRCLCEYENGIDVDEMKCAISSPESSEECWRKIASVVKGNSGTHFYVFDDIGRERERVIGGAIGKPFNLHYIDKDSVKDLPGELMEHAAL